MKTAISLPDPLFEQAEHLAQERGVSRSHLYAQALEEYLNRAEEATITSRLNAVYESFPSGLDADVIELQALSLEPEPW
jgi:metal-responsive CopG/Arc/MetJ family transcriptional regulator